MARTTTRGKELTVREAAKLLDVSAMTVNRYFRAGHLKGYRTSHAKTAPIKIYLSSVVEFAKKEQGREIAV